MIPQNRPSCIYKFSSGGGQSRAGRLPAWSHTEADDSTAAGKPHVASIVDEVIWVVGDEAILKSDVEAMRLQSEAEGVNWNGDPVEFRNIFVKELP